INAAGFTDSIEPGGGAIAPYGCGAHDPASRGLELPHASRVERMDGGNRRAVERRIELTPFARRHHRTTCKAERLEHHADPDGIGGENIAPERHGRRVPRAPPSGARVC